MFCFYMMNVMQSLMQNPRSYLVVGSETGHIISDYFESKQFERH